MFRLEGRVVKITNCNGNAQEIIDMRFNILSFQLIFYCENVRQLIQNNKLHKIYAYHKLILPVKITVFLCIPKNVVFATLDGAAYKIVPLSGSDEIRRRLGNF